MKKILILVVIFNTGILHSQDRLFTYSYQSGVLNKGQQELEVSNAVKAGRIDFYSRFDNRTEFEIGLGKNVQTAFYLNLSSISNTLTENSIKSLETENEISFSNEWKFKLLDPVINPFGLALYAEYGIGSKEYEFEGKLIIDKKINDINFAFNASFEKELKAVIENNLPLWENEQTSDFNFAIAYSLNPRFHFTAESLFENVFENMNLLHNAIYAGPGFSYAMENFWINFTVMPQIIAFKQQNYFNKDLNEFEKVQIRLIFSHGL